MSLRTQASRDVSRTCGIHFLGTWVDRVCFAPIFLSIWLSARPPYETHLKLPLEIHRLQTADTLAAFPQFVPAPGSGRLGPVWTRCTHLPRLVSTPTHLFTLSVAVWVRTTWICQDQHHFTIEYRYIVLPQMKETHFFSLVFYSGSFEPSIKVVDMKSQR